MCTSYHTDVALLKTADQRAVEGLGQTPPASTGGRLAEGFMASAGVGPAAGTPRTGSARKSRVGTKAWLHLMLYYRVYMLSKSLSHISHWLAVAEGSSGPFERLFTKNLEIECSL